MKKIDLSVRAVAEEIGLCRKTVKKMIVDGDLPGYHAGPSSSKYARYRITRIDLDRWKEARKQGQPSRVKKRATAPAGTKRFV